MADFTKTVTEYCSSCETEIEMRWDVDAMGYKAFCPVCGERLMLCDECQHRGPDGDFTDDCDYDSKYDNCRFNPGKFEPLIHGEFLDNVARLHGINRRTNESDVRLCGRILDKLQEPVWERGKENE